MNPSIENKNQAEKILTAAILCLAKKGYANVSMRDIAEEAGVALSQVHYYFKSKEGLFTEVIITLGQKFALEVEEHIRQGNNAEERLFYLIHYFQDILKREPELFKIFFDLTSMALWSDHFRILLDSIFENLTILIEKYVINDPVNQELLNICSARTLSKVIFGVMYGGSIQSILAPGEENTTETLSAIQLILAKLTNDHPL